MQAIDRVGKRLLRTALFAMAIFGPHAFAGPIYLDRTDRQWLDVNDIRDVSWNQLASVCSSTTGACIGSIQTWRGSGFITEDITGYTWASQDDVRDLFYEIAGLPDGTLDSGSAKVAGHYGVTALNVFPPTFESGTFRILDGLTRSTVATQDGNIAAVRGAISYWCGNENCTKPPSDATFSVGPAGPLDFRYVERGTYLFRPVPEPDSIVLVVAGLGLATVWLRRRRTPQSN